MSKLQMFLQKRRNAMGLGTPFLLSKDFRIPERIKLRNEWHPLHCPDQAGILIDFQDILFCDSYGLATLPSNITTVIDIGANIGLFCLAARKRFPQATIHAYEPNQAVDEFLSVQAKAADAKYFYKAVGSKTGFMSLVNTEGGFVVTQTRYDTEGAIPVITLDDCVNTIGGSVDLLKVDCEGAEWDIFQNKEAMHRVKRLVMEYHLWNGVTEVEEMEQRIKELGFTILRRTPPQHGVGLLAAKREGV